MNNVNVDKALEALSKDLNLIEKDLEDWNIKYFNVHRGRYHHDLEVIKEYYDGGVMVEVGSLPCHMTYCLKIMGFPIIGVDLNPERSQKFIDKHDLEIRQCNIETGTLPFKDNSVDFIIFNEIFEHMRINPIATLKELNRILKPGGQLMLSTPNLYSFYTVQRFLRGKGINDPYDEFEKIDKLGHMGHVREYSTSEVTKFLHNTGFEVFDVRYSSYDKLNSPAGLVLKPFLMVVPKMHLFQVVMSRKVKTKKKK